MPAAAILDIDGTLVDSNDAHAHAWVDALAEAGIPVPFERVRRAIGMGGDKLLPSVAGLREDSPEGTRISQRRAEIFKTRYLPAIRPFPRVRELVQSLIADGFTIVVATSAKAQEVDKLLEIARVKDLITAHTSSDDAERSKPDPDIVEAALEQSGADRRSAIMLGDTPYDLEAARRAGLPMIGVESGGWSRFDLSGAQAVYSDVADLLEYYDGSPFAHLSARLAPGARPSAYGRLPWIAVSFVAAGAALAVMFGLLTGRQDRRRSGGHDAADPALDDDREPRPAGGRLTRRDRERLRRLIARTS